MRRVKTFAALAAAATLALTAAGCTGTATPGPTGGSTPPTTGASIASTSTQPPSTASTALAAVPECQNHDLEVSDSYGGGAGGHTAELLHFTNVSGRTCFLQGYPGATLKDSSGRSLRDAQRTLDGFLGSNLIGAEDPGITAPPRITLAAGHYAIAELEWEDNDITGVPGGCLVRQSQTLLVTAPDSTESTSLPGLSDVCDAFDIGPVLQNTAAG